ncbi:hypothetical protein VN12_00640 [Pirellula sp. SH-Sr6A]|uniref:terpene cyclase/mutase family protein n=1 Tax=Pirellula sp. SH-Sr6A TaxID=1632865 RepID=UPI00078E0289|nr:terpene cyclase/mutase family protein [Pirellula sp. SH-Sr6A]AMV30590.1 hypothetical protein VN12_00640 [Pirellula sp. SH-Sr6A]
MSNNGPKNQWIASLCSFILHLVLLILLAIWTIAGSGIGERFTIFSGDTEQVGKEVEVVEIQPVAPSDATAGVGLDDISTSTLLTESPISLETGELNAPQSQTTLSDQVRFSGSAKVLGAGGFLETSIESRKPQNRQSAAQKYGATPQSEAAVNAALVYLAAHQKNNGSWSMGFDVCQNNCTDGCRDLDQHEIAATGLALLCFLGAGHTPNSPEYGDTVSRGLYFLVQNLKEKDGTVQSYWLGETAKSQMYEHGIATLAICEALQMGGDDSLREACQRAINFIISAQHKRGGWRYHPGQPGDLSVVGWQILALKSASAAKLRVPMEVLRLSDLFLKESCSNGYLFNYAGGEPTQSMTAIGNLIRLFRGYSLTDGSILRANRYLAEKGPSASDVYYNYYATQFMFHGGGKNWENWNFIMRELLVSTQVQQGHMAGSWYWTGNPFNREGGRIYVTTMCCLTLEVYYRYLPLYETSTNEFRL